jgi:phosphonate degradation associated HDIG domain protein
MDVPTCRDLVDLLAQRGHRMYAGEGVTQLQHAWQCGALARAAGAPPALEAAAWLHDIGHLFDERAGTPTLEGIDDRHELRGAAVLRTLLGPAVAEPVALHVEAKRCLVATQPAYRERLSADSIRSLALQGGPMEAAQAAAWRRRPYAGDALRLRAWDDAAKDPALAVPRDALARLGDLLARCAALTAAAHEG